MLFSFFYYCIEYYIHGSVKTDDNLDYVFSVDL